MTRLVGPDESCRVVYLPDGTARAQGSSAPLYADEACTILADVRSMTGDVIAGSTVLVDAWSKLPLMQYPDSADVIYTVINGGPVTALYARADDRIDALTVRVAAVEPGGDSSVDDSTLVHLSGPETITGVKTFTVSPVVPTPTTSGQAAPKSYADSVGSAALAALAAHEADTTGMHGIADTSTLETTSGAQAKATAAQAGAVAVSADRTLSNLTSASTARTSLGLGGAAILAVGTTAGTVAAGDDSRFAAPDGLSATQRVFYPTAYGAAGDGVTDDTAAIGSAFTALKTAGGGVLDFLGLTYLVSGLVFTGGSDYVLRGAGAKLILRGNAVGAVQRISQNVLTIADSSDFEITGLIFDGRRDTIAADQFVQSALTTGDTTVTVPDGTKFTVGERIGVFGGLSNPNTTDANKKDQALTISNIAGNVLTFSPALANSYQAAGTTGGTYVTRYQQGSAITVAGRQLSGEDQQCGLLLINCHRARVVGNIARNVWQSPIRLGTGFLVPVGDGCTDVTVTDNTCVHGYDQGVSVWNSQRITVSGNNINDTGWGGVVLTAADDCTVTGNTITAQSYRIPGDTDSGSGIAIEGGARNVVTGNVCVGNHARGLEIGHNPQGWGITIGSPPTLTGYHLRNLSTLTVSSSAAFVGRVRRDRPVFDLRRRQDGDHSSPDETDRDNHHG
jgi:parallel beta-helix repeat protein